MPSFRTIDFWHKEWPTRLLWAAHAKDPQTFTPVDRLAKCGTAVAMAYSAALRAGTPIPAKAWWGRWCLVEGLQPWVPPGEPDEFGEVHQVPAPMELLDLPDLARRRGLLEFLHEHLILLGQSQGWDLEPLVAARQAVLDQDLSFRLVSPTKSSPDRRHRAWLEWEIDGDGDGSITLHVTDRLGEGRASTEPLDASESIKNWNAAKKSLTWDGSARVVALPWARETPGPTLGADRDRELRLTLTVR
jgi:hypothetical protein